MADAGRDDDLLAGEIERLLSNSLGAWPGGLSSLMRRVPGLAGQGSAPFHALRTAFLYLLITVCGAWLVSDGNPERHLLSLSIWGAPYLGWAVFSSHRATARVMVLLREDVLPLLSERTKQSISHALKHRFDPRRVARTGWCVALIAIAAATLALGRDLARSAGLSGSAHLEAQLGLWALGWLAIFFTAARCTDVARFYSLFAEHLRDEERKLYPLDPSASALVIGVTAVGRTIFTFWVGISISVATLMPILAVLPIWSGRSYFGWIVLPISLFFSLVFATFVFLKSESAIRRVVQRVVRQTLAGIEREIAPLLAKGPKLEEAQQARLKALVERHDLVARSGSYRSLFLQGLSVIPLLSSIALIARALYEMSR
jgi:hypothetical protein